MLHCPFFCLCVEIFTYFHLFFICILPFLDLEVYNFVEKPPKFNTITNFSGIFIRKLNSKCGQGCKNLYFFVWAAKGLKIKILLKLCSILPQIKKSKIFLQYYFLFDEDLWYLGAAPPDPPLLHS